MALPIDPDTARDIYEDGVKAGRGLCQALVAGLEVRLKEALATIERLEARQARAYSELSQAVEARKGWQRRAEDAEVRLAQAEVKLLGLQYRVRRLEEDG